MIFWSPDVWDGPTSLHEMLHVQDERILSLAQNYQIHQITPFGLSDQELDKFQTSLREVLALIKYANDKDGMNRTIQNNGHKLRREDMKKEVAEETAKRVEAETKDSTLLENLKAMIETLHLSADQAMAVLKVPETKRTIFSAML